MTWFKVDDGLAFHTKTLEAGNAAMGLWVRAGAASARELTDGFVPTRLARQLGTPAEARRLVAAGLWLEVDGGYQFHEWEQANPTRAEVEDRRSKRAEAGRLGGLKSGRTRATNEANASAGASTMFEPPARPGPYQTPLLTLISRLAARDAGAHTPPPAEVTAAWQTLAGAGVDLEAEAAAYLMRHGDRPARDERGAWLGWLRAARRRHDAEHPVPRPRCGDPACVDGWLPDDPDTARPRPCPTCKPHRPQLRAVPDAATEAS